MKVYVLQHEHEVDGASDAKLIGVYASEAAAAAARDRVGRAPGFRDEPEGFSIDAYEVGTDHWIEGYVTEPAEPRPGARTRAA